MIAILGSAIAGDKQAIALDMDTIVTVVVAVARDGCDGGIKTLKHRGVRWRCVGDA